jgi:DNA-binding NarL/FixJ family response regulator
MVYAELVALYPTLPVIFSTGHTDRGGLEHLLSNENVGYLMKPYDYDALLKELTRVMASRVY